MRIPIEALELHRFVSGDFSRTNINHLWIEKVGPGKVRATATDGAALAQHEWAEEPPAEKIFLQPTEIKKLLAKTAKKERLLGAVYTPGNLALCSSSIALAPTPSGITPPDVAQVIPPRSNQLGKGEPFGVSLEYLARAYDWTKRCDRSLAGVRIQMQDALSPIRIDVTDEPQDTIFVVMPIRI